ncbi:uncharacterized protein [Misgurnus anguillicaudatus]|uniref:uncharacterized protein n=1 Tax=Misgurnus anguillicaudatus TaxID=75329 RepID=UPI003CCF5833
MDQVEERLAEEVRKYVHLYDTTSSHYKDAQMASNSWREIVENMGLEKTECLKRWKNMRDKFVRLRKKLGSARSGDPGGKKVPALYIFLSWLEPHVKHRQTESNYDKHESANENGVVASSQGDETPTEYTPAEETQTQSMASSSSPESSSACPPSPLFTSPKSTHKRKRREPDEDLSKQLELLEARRCELQNKLLKEYSRFGETVADMLRRLPDEHRPQAIFDIYKLLFDKQQQK